jgi:ABC-2 type transport system ATP-binding protein
VAVAPAILVDAVTKRYPGRPRWPEGGDSAPLALAGVTLAVGEGETVGLLGPNGAGKTTLLKIVSTLLYPTSGRVVVAGCDTVRSPRAARRAMGVVTCDERSFYWRLSGRHNLEFFAALYGIPAARARERIGDLFEALGLAQAADRPFHSYSSGMKQKLAIARGLLGDPAVLLYDEPTRSLDPLSAQNIREWIAANRRRSPRTAHLLATNQLAEAEQLCDRVVIINGGTVIAEGTVAEIRERFRKNGQAAHRIRYRGPALNGNLRAAPDRGLLEVAEPAREGDVTTLSLRTADGSDGLSLALQAILGAGGVVLDCASETAPFDEVFCSIVRSDQSGARPAGGTP